MKVLGDGIPFRPTNVLRERMGVRSGKLTG